jgi:hypothetical protein
MDREARLFEKNVLKAIKAMDAAFDALGPLVYKDGPEVDANNSVARLRADLAEYSGYLENATWWRVPRDGGTGA